jgi:hypothetical protein
MELVPFETRLVKSLEQLKNARLRVDNAGSEAARDEALRQYDRAIREFRKLAVRVEPVEDLLAAY